MLFLVEIEMKFCRNFANMLKNVQIHLNSRNVAIFQEKSVKFPGFIEKFSQETH